MPANWYPRVQSCFDGLAPSVTDLIIPIQQKTVVALLFDTSRAPFVVRNVAYGTPDGGPVEREVPWREHIAIRSASREDLIQLLTPLQRLPVFEIFRGDIIVRQRLNRPDFEWNVHFGLYVIPMIPERVVIPFHHSEVTLEIPGTMPVVHFGNIRLYPPSLSVRRIEEDAPPRGMIWNTRDEVLIDGPGGILLSASLTAPVPLLPETDNSAIITGKFYPVLQDVPVLISATLSYVHPPYLADDYITGSSEDQGMKAKSGTVK